LNELKLERDTSQVPLVPVVVRHQNYQQASLDELSGDLSAGRQTMITDKVTTSELDFQFYGDGDSLEVNVEFASDLFSEATIQRLLQHHQRVLEQMVAKNTASISSYDMLTEQEKASYQQWSPSREAISPVCVPELFEQQVEQRPDAIACYCAGEAVSYLELNERANQVAHYLRSIGVRRNTRVALFISRSSDYLVGLLGVLKCGGSYIPLDPNYPPAYLSQIMADGQPEVIVTQSALLPGLPSEGIKTLCLEDEGLAQQPAVNLGEIIEQGQLAYIMYTSGSTGEPKGVMVPHRQILNVLSSLWRDLPLGEQEVIAQKTSTSFAVSVKELLSGLLAGSPVAFIADDVVKDSSKFIQALSEYGVTRLYIVPSHLESVLEQLNTTESLQLAGLKYCITAGEPLTTALANAVQDKLPGMQLLNNYGCTELNDITYYRVSETEKLETSSGFVPIGQPISNSKVYVLDDMLRQVPFGVTGEVCVEGANLP
ncbi:AMP-binding protein, partial [Vibrio sp. 10N.237.312.B06]|uniref:AMP-binding protein n=1 Tax=Vibrio sp. 10N.237.312.B06 TaxID=3229974 RepID=UPI00354D45CC